MVDQDFADPYAPLQRRAPERAAATTPSVEAEHGLTFWKNRGYSTDQMFNAQGQLNPGWSHTQTGYWYEPPIQTGGGGTTRPGGGGMTEAEGRAYDAQRGLVGGYMGPGGWVSGSPSSGGGGGGYGGFGGGDFDPYKAYGRDLSQMLNFPAYQNAPAFAFDPFSPSSWADAENEPGYAASREQLRKQIEAGAAHRGMLRSGMTIGDLYTNLDALSQQNFRQFDDRRFRNWAGNRDLAATQHARVVDDIDRANNFRFNVADRSAQDALQRWKTVTDGLIQMSRPVE